MHHSLQMVIDQIADSDEPGGSQMLDNCEYVAITLHIIGMG